MQTQDRALEYEWLSIVNLGLVLNVPLGLAGETQLQCDIELGCCQPLEQRFASLGHLSLLFLLLLLLLFDRATALSLWRFGLRLLHLR